MQLLNAAVLAHALAAERALAVLTPPGRRSGAGMLAGDIVAALPQVLG
jgi:hypothetical protein